MLTLYDSLAVVDVESVVGYVRKLQQPDGSFTGDKWGGLGGCVLCADSGLCYCAGEVDTRFSFCALAILALLVSG